MFLYERYSKTPIKDGVAIVDINKLYNPPKIKTIDEQFDEYMIMLEKQRGYKYSRQQRREIYRKFIKNLKKR